MAASKSKKANSKNSKFRSFIHKFDPTSKKGMLMLFVVSFALVGGGYAAYRTFAASYPPSSMRQPISFQSVTATDGIAGPVYCISVAGDAGAYGYITQCLQYRNNNSQARPGFFNLSTRTFSQNGGYLNITGGKGVYGPGGVPGIKCKNLDHYFVGTDSVSAYGTAKFGQIYRIGSYSSSGAKWQVKTAVYSQSNGQCTVSGGWLNASSWDNVRTN